MFEAVPQELKDEAEKALRKASRDVYEVLAAAESLVDEVSQTLEQWADALAGGTKSEPSQQDKYQYLLDNTTGYEHDLYVRMKDYLKGDLLNNLYEVTRTRAGTQTKTNWIDDLYNMNNPSDLD